MTSYNFNEINISSCIINVMKRNEEIKIIFTDVDWTILNHGHGKHVYDKKSLKALKKAQSKGVKVFISTARPHDSLKLTGFFDEFKPDGMILANGAIIFVEDEIIHHDYMTPSLVNKICDVAKKNNIVVQFVSEYDRWISEKINDDAQHYFDVFFEKIPEIRGYNGENVSGMLLFCDASKDEKVIKEIDQPDLDVFRLFPYAIDVREHLIQKSDGINKVLEHYGFTTNQALALGDDVQDVPMFKLCKYSAAMENGNPIAKEAASYITNHIDCHGVKQALKYFKVI